MEATYKRLSMQYRKNGNEYVDYQILDDEGYVKSISPTKWIRLKLPDLTTEHQITICYTKLISEKRKQMVFGRFIDFVNDCKKHGLTLNENPKECYLKLINNTY